jgi:outer membrane protein assembly factor BamB
MRRLTRAGGWILAVGFLLAPTPARALITRLTPLADVLEETPVIVTARVDLLDPARPGMVLVIDGTLKGNAPFERLPVNLVGDREAARASHTPQLLKRLASKLPLVLVIRPKDQEFTAFAYTNGTWFQLTGTLGNDGARGGFTHCEPYFRKTFKGPTADLKQVITDVLAGKQKPPEPDRKEKPGLGPEVEPEKPRDKEGGAKSEKSPAPTSAAPVAGGPLFGVIPTVLVGGPLALLAMLFPALFGGLMLVLRRWMAALSVLSLNSTLFLLQGWFAGPLANSWWGTPLALWLSMTGVTLLGLLWAWRRHLEAPAGEGPNGAGPAFHRPGLSEVLTLGASSLVLLVVAVVWLPHTLAQLEVGDKMVWMFAAGLWVATLHACWLRWVAVRKTTARSGLPGEGVLLWAMTTAGMVLGATFLNESAGATEEEGPCRVAWRFGPPVRPCWIASSPLVDGDRVYIAADHASAYDKFGAVYCVDRRSGKLLWTFNEGGKMKDAFSSPCVAGGRLYIGEGFHQDQDCKLYCLDASTGRKLWDFQTASHTESSPCVAAGKVYFGAGDDGLYCLDAATGEKRWHLEKLHVDAPPLVINGRVYAGSGYNGKEEQAHRETVLFCLDAETGKQHWRIPTDLSVWGQVAVDGGRLYAGLANGDFMEGGTPPAGGVLCVDADTGKRVWYCDVHDGVLGRVVVDAGSVYCGSRDGNLYAIDRKEGKVRWKTDMGSPVLAAPVLLESGSGAVLLYAAAADGRVARVDAKTGKAAWTFEVGGDARQEAEVFSSPAAVTVGSGKGERRRIYFGCGLNNRKRGVLYCLEDREAKAGP